MHSISWEDCRSGFNLTQLDGDQFYGFNQAGISVGPMQSYLSGNKKMVGEPGVAFFTEGKLPPGSDGHNLLPSPAAICRDTSFSPFHDKKNVSAGLGFCYGQLIGVKESSQLFMVPHSDFSNDEVSVVVEGQVRMWDRLWLGVRYQYSILS